MLSASLATAAMAPSPPADTSAAAEPRRLAGNTWDGYGRGVYACGTVYEGGWRDGRKSGWGLQTAPGGDEYAGGWLEGKMHGYGHFRCALAAVDPLVHPR